MNKRLIIQSGDDGVKRMLDLTESVHRGYAAKCDADYWRFDGRMDPDTHPAWNRFAMALDSFGRYEFVLWLDADTLVVDQSVNVFEQAMLDHSGRGRLHINQAFDPTLSVFCMRRTAGGFYWPMDGDDQYEGWNDGVLLMRNSIMARDALTDLWGKRTETPLPHHQPTLWELNWLLDYVKGHSPWVVAEMDQRFNWQPFNGASPEQYAVIKAWHGLPHEQRWSEMRANYERLYA